MTAVWFLVLAAVALVAAWFSYDDDESRFGFCLLSIVLALASTGLSVFERWQMGVL